MQGFWRFLNRNRGLLMFGLLLTFFSSFGQTFLISLYIPSLEGYFGLSNTEISSMYATATMASAFTLPWVGKLVDTLPLRRFVLLVILGLVLACFGFSLIRLSLLLIPAFYGLRLFGQGLMSHTAVTTMARAFEADRGKAIGIATTGHSMGEALLPFLISLLILNAGWRTALQVEALVLFAVVLPILLLLLRGSSNVVLFPRVEKSSQKDTFRNPLLLFRDAKFWIIGPTVFILGFLNTAVFFYQLKFGASRGWAPEWIAGSLAFFALGGAVSMVVAGPFVDRLSAKSLFPVVLFPYFIGIVLLALGQFKLAYPLALLFLALSNGAGSTIKNALFAEVYGTEIIGAVRSMFTTLMVFSTALGPLSFGLLLDAGWSFGQVFLLSAAVLLAIIFWSWLFYKRL